MKINLKNLRWLKNNLEQINNLNFYRLKGVALFATPFFVNIEVGASYIIRCFQITITILNIIVIIIINMVVIPDITFKHKQYKIVYLH